MEKPVAWEYTFKKPAQDWKDVGFRDKMWLKAPGGFGTQVPGASAKTKWTGSDIWMRASFGSKDIPSSLALEIYYDEDVEVYLNGVEIYRAKGYVTSYQKIPLGQEALSAFQTGKNVIAVHCKQTGGGQFIDLALRTGFKEESDLNQVVNPADRKLVKDLIAFRKRIQEQLSAERKESFGPQINAVKEFPEVAPMHVHVRGSAHAPGEEVQPAFLAVLHKSYEPVPAKVEPQKNSSGRRLALAKWIASAENPLTSRVMVNRIWQHHFGRGIVPSSSDFGKLGKSPRIANSSIGWRANSLPRAGVSRKCTVCL